LPGDVDDFAVFDQPLNAEASVPDIRWRPTRNESRNPNGIANEDRRRIGAGATSCRASERPFPSSSTLLVLTFAEDTVRPTSNDGSTELLGALSKKKIGDRLTMSSQWPGYRGKGLSFNGKSSVVYTDCTARRCQDRCVLA